MKKIKFISIFIIVFSFFVNVNASGLPYNYIIDGVTVNDTNSDGSATVSKTSDSITLTLNNFKGSSVELNCYGTGQDGITFNVNLIGTNVIEGNDVGIKSLNKLNFIGNGTLLIKASTPISYESYKDSLYISPSENIYGTSITSNTEQNITIADDTSKNTSTDAIEEDRETEEETDDNSITISKTNLIMYIFFGYVILSIIVMSIMTVKIRKLEKK